MSITPTNTPIGRSSHRRPAPRGRSHARRMLLAALIAIPGLSAFTGRANAAIESRLNGAPALSGAAYASDDAALPVAASPTPSSDVATDSLAGSGIACIIVTLAALASSGGEKTKGRVRMRTEE